MIYMTPDNFNLVDSRAALEHQPTWGQIITPSSFVAKPKAAVWCGDNEAFTGKFKPDRFYAWLRKMQPHRVGCKFIACPDVVCNPRSTLRRYALHSLIIRALGFPVAFVCQDGQEGLPFPPHYDAIFIGGSTGWKMGPGADYCVGVGQAAGKWVHVGRVNSQKRIRHFQRIGVDSVDGTSLTYAPNRDYWRFQKVLLQKPLFTLEIET